jgi:short-chain fatty acids transporter
VTPESRGLERFAWWMGRVVPDAITACAMLGRALAAAALAVGHSAAQTLEAWYQGLWMLLPFTMQMTLIIVLSASLASTPVCRRGVAALARLPRTPHQVVASAVLLTAAASYLYWGLGIVLGPIVAIAFAREAEAKGIALDFPFLLAACWGGHAVWQYGLSASAPLLVATPGHFLEPTIGVLPLATTIGSPAAILHEVAYTIAAVAAACALMPRRARPVSAFPGTAKLGEPAAPEGEAPGASFSQRLEQRSFFALVLCAAFAAWLGWHFVEKGRGLDINALNTVLLLLTFLLHRSVRRFTSALQVAVVAGWPVIVLYHLYAGVAGLIQHTTLGERLAGAVASVATPLTFPFLTAVIATAFSIFIPSSGGQWAIQGFVTSQAALDVGVSVQRGLLAMSVGDHMGNLASPFWYMVVAGIAGVDFRSFFGYGLVYAALWFTIGTLVFTFAPC